MMIYHDPTEGQKEWMVQYHVWDGPQFAHKVRAVRRNFDQMVKVRLFLYTMQKQWDALGGEEWAALDERTRVHRHGGAGRTFSSRVYV
jgi:hypothetical protein